MILQHQLNPCSLLEAWESTAERVLPVLLYAKDPPSLPDQVFFFNWVSQITGCRFIDLIFFSAYNNMKYVPCKEQSSSISYIFINFINTLSLLLASQKLSLNNKHSHPCVHFLLNFTLNVFPPRGNQCLLSVVLYISEIFMSAYETEDPKKARTAGRWQDLSPHFPAFPQTVKPASFYWRSPPWPSPGDSEFLTPSVTKVTWLVANCEWRDCEETPG